MLRPGYRKPERKQTLQYVGFVAESAHRDLQNRCENVSIWSIYDNFVQLPEYIHWSTSPSSEVLWFIERPGYGKTILMTMLARQLERSRQSHEDLAYIFCKHNSCPTHCAILRSLICQLLQRDPGFLFPSEQSRNPGREHFYAGIAISDNQSQDELWQLLKDVLMTDRGRVSTILIDGIDELSLNDHKIFLNRLWGLLGQLPKHTGITVKTVLSSRPFMIGQDIPKDSVVIDGDTERKRP